MRQYLLDLYEIQKIDLGIREVEKRQETVSVRLKQLEASTTVTREELAKLTEQRGGLVKEARVMEAAVSGDAHKIKKWEARLNDIRNQREDLALNREVEEKIAEMHTQSDALDKQIAELTSKLAASEAELKTEREHVDEASAAIQAELAAETSRRAVLIPKVPKALFTKYDNIRARRAGVGLAPVTGGCCQGCNMKLPPQLYNILQRGETIEQCPSCNRVIFWDQILPSSEPTAGANA